MTTLRDALIEDMKERLTHDAVPPVELAQFTRKILDGVNDEQTALRLAYVIAVLESYDFEKVILH
jgi:hypothetical protein